ncbi:hypothetical protein U1Q18_006259, partial [Sarracenia purpurea var. burkii]
RRGRRAATATEAEAPCEEDEEDEEAEARGHRRRRGSGSSLHLRDEPEGRIDGGDGGFAASTDLRWWRMATLGKGGDAGKGGDGELTPKHWRYHQSTDYAVHHFQCPSTPENREVERQHL